MRTMILFLVLLLAPGLSFAFDMVHLGLFSGPEMAIFNYYFDLFATALFIFLPIILVFMTVTRS